VLTDVTEQELMEHALQTRQRMEAIGRLAGGVAHDFNNLLTVIIGYSDLLAERLGADHPFYDDVDAIREAGRRAAAFTEQLLTISGRRVAEAATVDVAATVRAIEPVLQRLVGADITLRVEIAPGTGWIKIDQGQFEQVILNLVVNARDAMPDGGILRMATGRTSPSRTRESAWTQPPWSVASSRFSRPRTGARAPDSGWPRCIASSTSPAAPFRSRAHQGSARP
jgi:signal transduction histidine kinase